MAADITDVVNANIIADTTAIAHALALSTLARKDGVQMLENLRLSFPDAEVPVNVSPEVKAMAKVRLDSIFELAIEIRKTARVTGPAQPPTFQ